MDVEGGAEDDGFVDVSGGDEVDDGIGSEEGGAADVRGEDDVIAAVEVAMGSLTGGCGGWDVSVNDHSLPTQSPKIREVVFPDFGSSKKFVHTAISETPSGSLKRHFSLPSLSCRAIGADMGVPTYTVSLPTASFRSKPFLPSPYGVNSAFNSCIGCLHKSLPFALSANI